MAKPNKVQNTELATTVAAPTTELAVVAAPAKSPVLQPLPAATVRGGTARDAAYKALAASVGQPRDAVLTAVKDAETAWHKTQGRVVKGINPGGWLRTFGATFAAPGAQQAEQDTTPPSAE